MHAPEALLATSPLELEAEICKRSLYEFAKRAWRVLEPGHDFVDNWHIRAICEHLEAVSRGEIRRLLINVPPRHMKSLLVSVLWPVWDWLSKPERQFLTASYVQKLSTRDALKSRQLIQSPWFQARFSGLFALGRDQNEKQRYQNDRRGYRIAISASGGVGEGGDLLIADDPQNTDEMGSDAYVEATTDWWNHTFCQRLNSARFGSIVLTMQRLAENDLSAVCLAEGGWEHLMLPAEFERSRICTTSIGFRDPRTREGELLWPEHVPADAIAGMKKRLGSYGTAGQLQQRPAPKGGGILKREHYKFIKRSLLPKFFAYYSSWDTAATENEANDPTGQTLWGLSREPGREGMFLLGYLEEWLDIPALHKRIKEVVKTQPLGTIQLIETAGPSGLGAYQQLKTQRGAAHLVPVDPKELGGGKTERARLAATYLEQGLVWLIEDEPGNEKFLSMSDAFPRCKSRDVVDSAIQAWLYCFTRYTFESSTASPAERFKYVGGGAARKRS